MVGHVTSNGWSCDFSGAGGTGVVSVCSYFATLCPNCAMPNALHNIPCATCGP